MVSNAIKSKSRVAFQGEHGAFSEEAALKLLGNQIELVPRPTFAALFSSIDQGLADYILAPVENTIAGVVHPAIELMEKSSLTMSGEVAIPVAQHLIGCPNSSFELLQSVQSHPVALAQCQRFFADHPQLKQVAANDTAGSVAEIIQRADATIAAIAGQRAAELYGGLILQANIQDKDDNYTRFVLLS